MAAEYIPVAELFAKLGLDVSELTDGLAEARIRLADINPEIISANAALREFANTGVATEEAIAAMTIALQEEFETRKAKIAETVALQKAAIEDVANMRRADIANATAEHARYQAGLNRMFREIDDAQADTNARFARQVALSPMGVQIAEVQAGVGAYQNLGDASETATGKMIVGTMRARTEAQALNEMLGTKIPGSISRMVAFAPAVAQVLDAVFDVVMVGAFLDILYHVGDQIVTLTNYMNGFGDESEKAWAKARDGVEATRKVLIDVQADELKTKLTLQGHTEEYIKAAVAGEKGKLVNRDIEALKEELRIRNALAKATETDISLTQALASPSSLVGLAGPALARAKIYSQGQSTSEFKKDNEARLKELQEDIRQAEKDRNEQLRDEYKDAHKKGKRPRMPGAEDHEEPYRMPWYMGPSAADSFQHQMGGNGRIPGMPFASGGASKNPFGSEALNTEVAPTNLTVKIVSAPILQFNGVPSDIQKFMRDNAEPALIADIEGNIRGLAAILVDSLKKHGLAVTSG